MPEKRETDNSPCIPAGDDKLSSRPHRYTPTWSVLAYKVANSSLDVVKPFEGNLVGSSGVLPDTNTNPP